MAVLNETIELALAHYSKETAAQFEADVFSFIGGIRPEYLSIFRAHMENLAGQPAKADNLAFFIHTPGGVAEVVEKMVDIIRQHYQEVWFVVPDMAMSAGTILCMSGDKIYMDYSSALGPIDPQIPNGDGQLVPALGYLDHVDRMIEKSAAGTLTDAEFAILQNQDLATLRRYEQARDLSISLLKDWLVKYKFKDWNEHSSSGDKVTDDEKSQRAEEIAHALSNHNKWHSHGRMIGIKTLTNDLRLRIEDYTDNDELKSVIRKYSDLMLDCVQSRRLDHLFHTGKYVASNKSGT
ncbi:MULTISPECIES: SDH family Clp fold serine proteinase [Pseudoalteromonas]|uniref:Serine dehydrogenasease n=1 Tax=Pseudoalteromonas amylolytica TaxID=1859457 RepID=A0A1S1MQ88_9GAMM|nr:MULTISPECIES: serine dehydrogenasease [Pseudoalteromonas]OHU87472.1 serine dehydrogenasease [Pseudoalteromonas sp. JW3]OHU90915.1 serine dehydrogenasease [Pseudoalteromonas amylolytica]